MSVIEEMIRLEDDGTFSFGNYSLETKKKVQDFENGGDLYKVKTYREITKLEKNGKLLLEAVPGATIHHFYMDAEKISFMAEALEDVQITMELENERTYALLVDGVSVGGVKANVAGKVSFGLELSADRPSQVEIHKVD